MGKVKFNSFKQKKNVYIKTNDNFASFLGVTQALRNLQGQKNYDFKVLVSRPYLKNIASTLGWLSETKLISELEGSEIITQVKSDTSFYTESDLEADYNYQSKKYPHIDPQRFKIEPFKYSELLASFRDVLEITKLTAIERPLDIMPKVKESFTLPNKVKDIVDSYLESQGYKNKPFCVADSSFSTISVNDCFYLPSEGQYILLSKEEQIAIFYLMSHEMCTGVGVSSDFWLPVACLFNSIHPFFIWNLDTHQEDFAYHINHELLSIVSLKKDDKVLADLGKCLNGYHKRNSISLLATGKREEELFRPEMVESN